MRARVSAPRIRCAGAQTSGPQLYKMPSSAGRAFFVRVFVFKGDQRYE
jgi:hypothetical protein